VAQQKAGQNMTAHSGDSEMPIEVREILAGTDPPGPAVAKIPGKWFLTDRGLYKWKSNSNGKRYLVNVTEAPLIISGRLKALETGDEWLELAWYRDGAWQSETVERLEAMHRNKIIEPSNLGSHNPSLPLFVNSLGLVIVSGP
jgi:hypothetical protein